MAPTILQIMPTDGRWYVLFGEDGEEGSCDNFLRVIAWALRSDGELDAFLNGFPDFSSGEGDIKSHILMASDIEVPETGSLVFMEEDEAIDWIKRLSDYVNTCPEGRLLDAARERKIDQKSRYEAKKGKKKGRKVI